MPVQETVLSPGASTSSFIGLQSYTEAQAGNFFGRDKEIETLVKLVESNTLTIVFGKSGTGKTSLLNAGVFPKLRKDYCLPFRIRLEFREDSPDILTQIKKVLKDEIDKYGFGVEGYPADETLWEYFHKELLWDAITPILVFDQFEEIFTLAKKNERFGIKEQEIFWEELADLIENSIPEKLKDQFLNNKEEIGYNYRKQKVKIVFSFREEFLPEFESITSKIPSIKLSRFRLLPMNGHQAYEVITKTWKDKIDTREARQIVSFFTNETNNESYELITVEPALLSQVCSYIDKEMTIEGASKVSAELLTKYPKETILRAIYEEAVEEGNRAIVKVEVPGEEAQRNIVKEFLEEKMITTEGYRTKYSVSDKDALLMPGIGILLNKYLVREDDSKLELTHDILAPIIKTDREKRRKKIALEIERKKARRKAFILVFVAILAAIGLFFAATYQARSTNNDLKKQIQDNADVLKHLQDSIADFNAANKGGNRRSGTNQGLATNVLSTANTDSTIETVREQHIVDSAALLALEKANRELNKIKTELETRLGDLTNDNVNVYYDRQRSDSLYRQALNIMSGLRGKIATDSLEIIRSNRAFTELTIRYNNLKDLYNALKEMRYPTRMPPDTNFNLKINLQYALGLKTNGKVPDNLTIFVIPDSSVNSKIIKHAKLYEIHCDETSLRKATNYRVATYYNGQYGIAALPIGKYFVKICSYYGGYYFIKTNGTQEFKVAASPPIR